MTDDLAPAVWVKSRRSSGNAACVEVAELPGGRAVRDSKNPTGGYLTVGNDAWAAFTAGLRAGEFD